jgi:hypothetical protein
MKTHQTEGVNEVEVYGEGRGEGVSDVVEKLEKYHDLFDVDARQQAESRKVDNKTYCEDLEHKVYQLLEELGLL